MFQFGRFPTYDYLIHHTLCDSSSHGFPHSDICGSTLICSSPQLFAACHVLRRLLMPRHSPYALLSLNSFAYPLDILFSELLCSTFYSYFCASAKIAFTLSEKPDFYIFFFPCFLKSLFVFAFLLIRFSMISRSCGPPLLHGFKSI